jgi:hypothetical protein
MTYKEAITSSFALRDQEDNEINATDSSNLIWNGLCELARQSIGKPIDPTKALEILDQKVAAFLREPSNPYILRTSLSVEQFPTTPIKVKDCIISDKPGRSQKFSLPKVLLSPPHKTFIANHFDLTKYRAIYIRTKGRTINEATSNAFSSLNLVRALWTLAGTYGFWFRWTSSPLRRPIGIIHLGPLHTLHRTDGSAADENSYWHEPDYRQDQDLFKRKDKWPEMEKFRKRSLRKILGHSYSSELQDLLDRYIWALDQNNPTVAFLQMWGILEKITNTVGAEYDKTIDRASWVYEDRSIPLVKDLLASLRHRRNRFVHSGPMHDNEEIVYMVKQFLDPHLLRLINNDFRVRSIQEYAEILSLPSDLNALKRRHEKLSMVLKWSKKKPDST